MKPKFTQKQLEQIREAAMGYDVKHKSTPARLELAAFWSQATLDVMARRGDQVESAELLAAIDGFSATRTLQLEYTDALITITGSVELAMRATPAQKLKAVTLAKAHQASAAAQIPLRIEAN